MFSEPTEAWFKHAFGSPTEAQREAWPAIRSGEDVLVIAPTGSGKTLSAFLSAIDRLMGRPAPVPAKPRSGGRAKRSGARGVTVLYVSPLKALAVDVAKNLQAPLSGIAAECEARGLRPPDIRVAARSGDTTPQERRAIVSHPPDILVTTPESLYLILTSKARRILATVDTVIVDEVHAVAGTKRGAHLALSLERLDRLTARPAQRIGLPATVNPPREVARFLGGVRPVRIVNPGSRPAMDLRVVEPLTNMRDLQSANVKHRAGGVDSGKPPAPRITGVTPAMQRLAERRGVAGSAEGSGAAASPGARGAEGLPSDSSAIVGAAGDRASGSIWPVVERSVLGEVLSHRTTLVFVNSRGLAEKLTARLNDLYAQVRHGGGGAQAKPDGEGYAGALHYDPVVGSSTALVGTHDPADVIAMAHHGSVSKDRRKHIEEQLKRGQLRCVVATSSLELGIDMGSVDLVIQIAPPLSVASGLQRVGRADHRVGGVSHALFYPLTREQLIGVAAAIEGMSAGELEPLSVPGNPLDILAQQTVAAAAMDDLKPDEWYATVRRSAPFADLDRSVFDSVMAMMTGGYKSEEFSAFRPPLVWNHDGDIISARPGAQRLAVTSGGTIPDRGLYTVVLPESDAGPGPKRVGELDEEMVYESRVGDVITLGTSSWQIQEITRDRVVVTPAPGRTARLPFWHGEGNGRDYGFGLARGRLLRELAGGLASEEGPGGRSFDAGAGRWSFDEEAERRLRADGLDDNALSNLAALLGEQRGATGVVPGDRDLVIERCPDEEGDWRIMLHSPFGRRVHEPWAMAITARIKQRYGFDGQAYAADDGIVLRVPDGEGHIDARGLFLFDPDDLQRAIETQVGESVLFAARFRECAARSLFLPRTDPGKRVPLWQQRLRAAQLLNAVRTRHNFPLLLETSRECLSDVYDLPALREIMTGLNAGTIRLSDVQTQVPSPFAESLLFGFVGTVMYQYDVPQAERSTQILSMDPEVLEKLIGATDLSAVLDPEAIAEVESQLASRTFWNELDEHDVIGRVTRYAKTHGPFVADRMIADLGLDATQAVHALDELKQRGELLYGAFLASGGDADSGKTVASSAPTAAASSAVELVGGGAGQRQWLHKEVFRRIRSRSLAKARKAVKPVDPDVYQAFVLDRQGVGPVGGERYEGPDGLMRVIEQLEGIALPIRTWDCSVFPSRVRDYNPAMLDGLLADGEVVWVGSATGDGKAGESGQIAFHPADSLLVGADPAQPRSGSAGPHGVTGGNGASKAVAAASGEAEASSADGAMTIPEAISAVLRPGGAYHASQLAAKTRELWQSAAASVDLQTGEITVPAWSDGQFEEALWSLVWQGLVTNSSLAPLRALAANAGGRTVRAPARASRRRVRVKPAVPATMGGLWSSVGAVAGAAEGGADDAGDGFGATAGSGSAGGVGAGVGGGEAPSFARDHAVEGYALAQVDSLLDRYGVIAQPLVDKERIPGGFSGLYPVLRRMEESGVLVRGMFVRGFGAAQFAGRDTVDALRDGERWHNRSNVALDATDPASLVGASVPWPRGEGRPARRAGTMVVLAQGRPVLYAAPKTHHLIAFDRSEGVLRPACAELAFALLRRSDPGGGATFADLNGEPLTMRTDTTRMLHVAGFTPCPQGMKLYR